MSDLVEVACLLFIGEKLVVYSFWGIKYGYTGLKAVLTFIYDVFTAD
jgi:hypothetical protein